MSEWDFDGPEPLHGSPNNRKFQGGKLHVLMTVVCFVSVAGISFLVAWLMKDRVRSFGEMGLTFAAPFAALMGSAMLLEHGMDRLTPECSRKAQLLCVLGTVVAAFTIGCMAEILHKPVVIEKVETVGEECDYIIVLDKSGSMYGSMNTRCSEAVRDLVADLPADCQVGVITFNNKLLDIVEIAPLTDDLRNSIRIAISKSPSGGTNIPVAVNEAMRQISQMSNRKRMVRIILVTDGEDSRGDLDLFKSWVANLNNQTPGHKQVELSAIQLGAYPMLTMVKDAVNVSGGRIYDSVDINELGGKLQELKTTEVVMSDPVDTLKATYNGQTADGKPNTPYMIMTCVLMILQGLLCGFALKIMFSVQGQRRVQTILSPAMGLAAFLLLNFGRHIGISPAWLCEALAFSLFGLVFMRENRGESVQKRMTAAGTDGSFDPDW